MFKNLINLNYFIMAKNRLDYQAQLSRHSHDISAGYTAQLATGILTPQFFHILGPGDTIYYSNHMFARLQDVVTAFLGEIDIHIDSFFVPLQMMYTPFGQVFAQTDDMISSLFSNEQGPSPIDTFPLLNLDGSVNTEIDVTDYDYVGGESVGKSCARLFDALNLNPLCVCSSVQAQNVGYQSSTMVDDQVCHNPNISPFILYAYHAIYQKYYRNDEIERLNVSNFNFDFAFSSQIFTCNNSELTCKYVQRPKDYFTDIRVSPIASAVNKFGSTGSLFPSNGDSLDSVIFKVDSFLDSSRTQYGSVGSNFNVSDGYPNNYVSFDALSTGANALMSGGSNPTTNSTLSAANIRALFAVDKFARIYGRADKTYDDQILAHFGVKIPHDVKHDLTHLSHFRAVLQSDPIYSTSITINDDSVPVSNLGQVGGQGSVDFTSSQDKFTAPVHGVFMVIAYAVTKPRYNSTFSKLHLLTDRLSFPIPEYDKLGAQPLYAFETNPFYLQNATNLSYRLGWQNRYQQFKEKYNRCSLTYFNGNYGHNNAAINIYSPWVISRQAYYPFSHTALTASRFVNPILLFESTKALDDIMVQKFETDWSNDFFETPHSMFQSDPIITEFMCNAKLVSWMSETGEPDL